jgi:hypothetical protein
MVYSLLKIGIFGNFGADLKEKLQFVGCSPKLINNIYSKVEISYHLDKHATPGQ